jgi:lipopolysaccharide export system permease protein
MLKKLDYYIISKYLKTFFFTVLLFTMVSVVIDFSNQVDKFLEESCTLEEIVVDYYLAFVPWINGLLFPLFALISVIFFTSRMAYNSEIISILNAGVSFQRMMIPYILASSLICVLHLIGNHYIIPLGNKSKVDFEHTYIYKNEDKGQTKDVHLLLEKEEGKNRQSKVYIRFYRKRDTTAKDLILEEFIDHRLTFRMKAKTAKWIASRDSINNWKLTDYEIRTFDGEHESMIFGVRKSIDTILNLYPEDFVFYENDKLTLTTPELRKAIALEKQRGVNTTKSYQVEIFRRTAEPFTIIIVTLIGMAIASRKVRGGLGLHLALGISIGAIYVFLSKFSTTFATNQSLPPGLAIWMPNILFTVILGYLFVKAQK